MSKKIIIGGSVLIVIAVCLGSISYSSKIANPFVGLKGLVQISISGEKVEKISDILYNRDEVEKLLIVPIDFFMSTEPVIEEIRVYNKPLFDVNKYNFTDRYKEDWHFPNRKVYIYMYENEAIWGMTAEIIFDFVNNLKKKI